MREVIATIGNKISLGRRGENMATCVVFNISEWLKTYGEGTAQLIHQRNGDSTPYPCVVEQSGSTVRWCITSADVDVAGRGLAELQYYVGDALVKSEAYTTSTDRAMGTASEYAPEPYNAWMDNMLRAASDAVESAASAEAAAASAEASADALSESARNAAASEKAAGESEEAAASSEQAAADSATVAISYAVGGTGTREGEDRENAKYYMEQAQKMAGGEFLTEEQLEDRLDQLTAESVGAAAASHSHSASHITEGTLAAARLPNATVSKGGTGRTTLTAGSYLVGNGTSSVDMKSAAQVLADIGAAAAGHSHSAADVGARSSTWLPTPVELQAYALNGGTEIPSGADLNTYTTPNCYRCTTQATAASLSNTPYTAGGFSLIVERTSGITGHYVIQTIKTGNINATVYQRAYTNGTWGEWVRQFTSAYNGWDLLWENASKGSSFAGQKISVSVNDYDFVMLVSGYNTAEANGSTVTFIRMRPYGKGATSYCIAVDYVTEGNAFTRPYREITIASGRGSVTFGDGYKADGTVSNNNVIPYYIYGIKGVNNP